MKKHPAFFCTFRYVFCFLMTGCVAIAPPSPMVTYGGPETTPKGSSETAFAMGSGSIRFEGAHSGGFGWFGRYKYGISEKFDLGIDAIGIVHSDKGTLSAKLTSRYQLIDNLRLEAGFGGADDSDGKSLNGDFGLTWGTLNKNNYWNYYATLRLGAAKGYSGNAAFSDSKTSSDTLAPADVLIGLLNLGAQGKISENQKFIIEGGYGVIFPRGYKASRTFYISCGLLFNIGK